MPKPLLPALQEMARLLGGEVVKGNVLCPGPGHSADDRSLSVTPSPVADCGFVVNSFAGDSVNVCKDYVREKLDLPPFEPKPKKRNGKGDGKRYSPTIARYIYRTADGQPYLCVHRLGDKKLGFPQYHWDGQLWKAGVPKGPKIPYRLPELIAAPATTPVYIVEGEGKCVLLAKLGFTVTSASEGAGKWTADLNEWFKDRVVYILPDNDEPGRKHAQLVARNLDPVAKSVRVVELPGLPHKGDIKQWLEHDPAGAKLVKECERAPVWEPTAEPPLEEDKASEDDDSTGDDGGGLLVKMKKQADILIELASTAELFHDQDDVGYARFSVNLHKENWPIRSKGFKRWLVRAYYESTQSAPSSEAMTAAMGVLEARAQFDAPEHDVRVRVAAHDRCIYIDLADRDWRAIEIDEDGWRVVDNPPVYSAAALA